MYAQNLYLALGVAIAILMVSPKLHKKMAFDDILELVCDFLEYAILWPIFAAVIIYDMIRNWRK